MGVVLLAVLLVLFFKLCLPRMRRMMRKDEEIRWPEVKSDAAGGTLQPLPARQTGGAGFDMGDESDEEPEQPAVHRELPPETAAYPANEPSLKAADSFNGSMMNSYSHSNMRASNSLRRDPYLDSMPTAAPQNTYYGPPYAAHPDTEGAGPYSAAHAEVPYEEDAVQPPHVY